MFKAHQQAPHHAPLNLRELEQSGRGGVEELEQSLHKLVKLVHPRHFTAMQVKRMLCLMYGNCSSHRLDNMKEKVSFTLCHHA